MKILLINPPRTYYQGSKGIRLGLPLGLMYLAAVLEKNGYHVKIFDCLIHPQAKIVKDGEKTIHGVSEKIISETIEKENPDIVGITNPFTAQIENAISVANLVKQVNKKIITVVGGPHVSVVGKKLLEENDNIDIGVKGEGEYVFLDVIRGRPIKTIKNLIYRRKNGQVAETEFGGYISSLDNLPYPAYHLIDLKLYFKLLEQGFVARPSNQKRSISMITSRGCPYNCIFCSIHLHMGKHWRTHSADYVINHLKYVNKNFGVKHISFEDDNFTFDLNRARKILEGIIKQNLKITWDTPNGVRADRLNEDLARLMKKSGCLGLIFGVESGEQEVLDKIINKSLNLNDVIKAAEICKKLKINTRAFFVIGFPGEKIKNMKKTTDFALMLRKKYGVKSGLLIATPLIGTKLYDICKKNGYLVEEPNPRLLSIATQPWGKGLIKTADFNQEQLKELAMELERKMARIDFTEKILHPLANFKSWKFLFLNPKKAFRALKNEIF